jgi:hypothetical protein
LQRGAASMIGAGARAVGVPAGTPVPPLLAVEGLQPAHEGDGIGHRGGHLPPQQAPGGPQCGPVRGHGHGGGPIGLGGVGNPLRSADGGEHRSRDATAGQIPPQRDHRQAHPQGLAPGGVATVGPGVEHQVGAGDGAEVGGVVAQGPLHPNPGRIDAAVRQLRRQRRTVFRAGAGTQQHQLSGWQSIKHPGPEAQQRLVELEQLVGREQPQRTARNTGWIARLRGVCRGLEAGETADQPQQRLTGEPLLPRWIQHRIADLSIQAVQAVSVHGSQQDGLHHLGLQHLEPAPLTA